MALPTDRMPLVDADREAARLFSAVFQRQPTPTIVERFRAVSPKLDETVDDAERQRYRRAIDRVRDLEALEFAARLSGRLPLLCVKFRVMAYISETVPENQHFFVSRRPNGLRALWTIAWGALRSLYKLVKGMFLLRGLGDA